MNLKKFTEIHFYVDMFLVCFTVWFLIKHIIGIGYLNIHVVIQVNLICIV